MACEIISIESAVFVLWGRPEIVDFDRLLAALLAARERTGNLVFYVTRVPEAAPPPSAEVRKYLDGCMARIIDLCAAVHVIVEGQGFFVAVKRAVLLSLFQLRWRHGVFFVHATSEQVRRAVGSADQALVARLLELAAQKGLLSHSASSEGASAA